MKKIHKVSVFICTLILMLFFGNNNVFAQGLTCSETEPFCAGVSTLIFENTSGTGDAEIGPDYGCLFSTPNPAWYYLQIDQTGTLSFDITQNSSSDFTGTPIDVDFIAYGPFTNTNACNQLTNANTVACSYSPDAVESFTIFNAQAGEVYVLLITNYDDVPGYIRLEQTNVRAPDAGLTDCSIVNGLNLCVGDIVDLDATTPNAVTYEWFQDGVLLPAEMGPILANVVAPSAAYTSTPIDNLGSIISTFEFNVNFEVVPIANPVADIIQCDDNNDGLFLFDLTVQTSQILGAQDPNEFTVTYHFSQADADNNVNASNLPFQNTVNPQIIYTRIENRINSECFDTTSFSIELFDTPTVSVENQLVCDDDNDGVWNFDLNSFNTIVLNGQDPTQFAVTYHLSQADADANVVPLASPYQNITSPQTIYVRVENNNNITCFNTNFFEIEVFDTPTANIVPDQLVCDDDNDGLFNFDLSAQTAQILGAQNPVEYTVTYHTSQLNADTRINPLTSPYQNSANPQVIYARIENNNNTDCFDTTSFTLVLNETPIANNVANQLVCDDDNNGVWSFDLTNYDVDVLIAQDPTQFTVTYHLTQADADNRVGPIPSPYSNVLNPQTIFIRIENNDNIACYDTNLFEIEVFDSPTANLVPDQFICDDDNDGFIDLDLNSLDAAVLGAQNAIDFTVTYYLSQADADGRTNAVASPYTNVTAYQQEEIFIRIENNLNINCFDTTRFMFDVFDTPTAMPVQYDLCDDDFDGSVLFDLASIAAQVLGTQDPLQFTVSYHLDQVDADNNAAPLPLNYINVVPNAQQIVVRVENNDQVNCFETALINLLVLELPIVNPLVELFQCDDDIDGFVSFNLTEANELISANYINEVFTYYTSLPDAENAVNAIVNPMDYVNIDSSAAPDILFVRIVSNNGCYIASQLNLLVSATNIPANYQLNYDVCDDTVIDGDDHNGVATFDFSTAEAQILSLFPGQALTISYYETLNNALAETNAIPDIGNHRNDVSPYVQNIYVRIDSDLNNACFGLGHHITLTVNPVPEIIAVSDYIVCEDNTDGIYDFDLESKSNEVLNGQDPAVFAVSYHETQADADANIAPLASPYPNNVNPQSIFVRITNTITGCGKSGVSFNIEVQEEVQANQAMPPFIVCDEFGDNDGNAQFDLSSQDLLVLNGQDPADYSVSYYLTQMDADLEVNALSNLYENITNPQTIYARVNDITIPNSICWATTEIELQVILLPIFDLDEDYLLCVNTNGTEVVDLPILDTQLSDADYSFEWSFNGIVMPAETASSMMPIQGGTYSVLVTNNVTGCQNTDTTIVNESSPPIVTATVSSLAFANNNIIEVEALGSGNYQYSLDNGPWQDSNVFENVSIGEHTITVRDLNGCGYDTTTIIVMDYPKYFTPNNDGFHDTWNIAGIDVQPTAKIFIYDRYGKLLKQLSPTGNGWDGTYNGHNLPSSDYWFTVEYVEPSDGNMRQFRAHFALKR